VSRPKRAANAGVVAVFDHDHDHVDEAPETGLAPA
jgi:hypothetical protein